MSSLSPEFKGDGMSLGPSVRRLLGPLERPAAWAYRSLFVDLESLVRQIGAWMPQSDALRILEVGCGEGMLTELLALEYPGAQIEGIDITPRVGRMFEGDRSRVVFRKQTIDEFEVRNRAGIDLLIIGDVMHHVPVNMRRRMLASARTILKPAGFLVLKEWARSRAPIHVIAYLADRYVTGDRVTYWTADQFRDLIDEVFGTGHIVNQARIEPWRNNVVFLVRN